MAVHSLTHNRGHSFLFLYVSGFFPVAAAVWACLPSSKPVCVQERAFGLWGCLAVNMLAPGSEQLNQAGHVLLPTPNPYTVTILALVPVQEPTVGGNWPWCNEDCCDEPIEDHRHFTLKTGLRSGHGGVLIMGEMLMFYVK